MNTATAGCLICLAALGAGVAHAQEPEPQLLDGTELEYTYTVRGTVVIAFYDGKLRYRWTAGPLAGTEEKDRVYRSRRIGDELYLVNWHDTENRNVVTLVINLRENVVHSSGLAGYGTVREAVLFDQAVIQRVSRNR